MRRQYVGTLGTSPPPPRNGKNCCRKMMLFPKALATTVPKIAKTSIFLLKFYQQLSKISQNFPTIRVFRPNVRKINAWFVKSFEKYAKIMHYLLFSYEIF